MPKFAARDHLVIGLEVPDEKFGSYKYEWGAFLAACVDNGIAIHRKEAWTEIADEGEVKHPACYTFGYSEDDNILIPGHYLVRHHYTWQQMAPDEFLKEYVMVDEDVPADDEEPF